MSESLGGYSDDYRPLRWAYRLDQTNILQEEEEMVVMGISCERLRVWLFGEEARAESLYTLYKQIGSANTYAI